MVLIPLRATLSTPMTVHTWPGTTRRRRQGRTLLHMSTWLIMCLDLQPTTSIFLASAVPQGYRSLKAGRMAMMHGARSSMHPKDLLHEHRTNHLCYAS